MESKKKRTIVISELTPEAKVGDLLATFSKYGDM